MTTPQRLLWASMALALVASLSHVAAAFGTLEHGGAPAWLAALGPYAALVAALAIDCGLAALAWAVGERARSGERARDLWAGVAAFAALSALANLDHALAVVGGGASASATWAALGAYDRVKVASLSGGLPLVVLYLARVLEVATSARAGASKTPAGAVAPVAVDEPKPTVRTDYAALLAAAEAKPTATIAELAAEVGRPRRTVGRWAADLGERGTLTRERGRWRVAA